MTWLPLLSAVAGPNWPRNAPSNLRPAQGLHPIKLRKVVNCSLRSPMSWGSRSDLTRVKQDMLNVIAYILSLKGRDQDQP